MHRAFLTVCVAVAIATALAPLASAQASPAPIKLSVDATQAPQKILHSHLEFPVQPGPLTLYYPEWIPGEHMPDGPIIEVAGMKFSAGRQGDSVAARLGGDVFDPPRRSRRRHYARRGF